MQIKMYVKEGGIVAFECQGVFKEPVEKIILDKESRSFSLLLKESGDAIPLDCPIDEEVMEAMGPYSHCIMGFCDGNQILMAAMVPIESV